VNDSRSQIVNVKVATDFGSLHFCIKHDDANRVTAVYWATHDSDLTEDTQLGKLLRQCTDGINKAIESMNTETAHKWDLAAIARRVEQ
jgi:hypothetical protein